MTQSETANLALGNETPGRGTDITLAEAGTWVSAYGKAWVGGDLEAWLDLFAPGAVFREARFAPAAIGHDAMAAYWRARRRPQYGNSFAGEALVMRGHLALAHWTATFTWRPTNMTYQLDAISRVALLRGHDDRVRASQLEHWIDRELSEPLV